MAGATSFSAEVRDELAATLPDRACCRQAFLSALIRGAGTYHLRGRGQVHIELEVAAGPAARRLVELLRGMGATCQIRSHRQRRFYAQRRIDLVCGADADTLAVLRRAGILNQRHAPLLHPPRRLLGRRCCRCAYLRGAFIAGGSVAAPRRGAQLEIRSHAIDGAIDLARIAADEQMTLRTRERADHAVSYTKRRETIQDFLARIGAPEAALRLAEADVMARAREHANRRANAETANLRRQVLAARRQLRAIETLAASDQLAGLSNALRVAAALRVDHPDLALAELAALAAPPLAKPTLARRLRRLEALA